ncbi:hypothetical protein NC652_018806 [Populus alba x Populus x berolinensis]|uniref:Uncharacterized protein n=1 Tax=Populus alba x Populus x berolinensis TaxID=444605 RepID=A0AAD6QGZ8_9ROSI|nr:hypothetical protein NC652_018806 [Populus alba x Populus x berolinensis]KAJ6990207.1 hypothetical protein NC653_018674 [Populus alba x Populus x berolinensis]
MHTNKIKSKKSSVNKHKHCNYTSSECFTTESFSPAFNSHTLTLTVAAALALLANFSTISIIPCNNTLKKIITTCKQRDILKSVAFLANMIEKGNTTSNSYSPSNALAASLGKDLQQANKEKFSSKH